VLEVAVDSGDLDRAAIVAAMEDVDTLRFNGLSGDYRYGSVGDREPPRTASIFRVDRESPWGLAIVARDVSSDVAAGLEL
jgi:hypothetical protein